MSSGSMDMRESEYCGYFADVSVCCKCTSTGVLDGGSHGLVLTSVILTA